MARMSLKQIYSNISKFDASKVFYKKYNSKLSIGLHYDGWK